MIDVFLAVILARVVDSLDIEDDDITGVVMLLAITVVPAVPTRLFSVSTRLAIFTVRLADIAASDVLMVSSWLSAASLQEFTEFPVIVAARDVMLSSELVSSAIASKLVISSTNESQVKLLLDLLFLPVLVIPSTIVVTLSIEVIIEEYVDILLRNSAADSTVGATESTDVRLSEEVTWLCVVWVSITEAVN